MEFVSQWFAGLCGGRGKFSDRDRAASKIQARYRGVRARDEQLMRQRSATKIQAVFRGAKTRRDHDTRSLWEKKQASQHVSEDMHEMKSRMKAMAKAMDKHDAKVGEKMVDAYRRNGQQYANEADQMELRNRDRKRHSSRKRL